MTFVLVQYSLQLVTMQYISVADIGNRFRKRARSVHRNFWRPRPLLCRANIVTTKLPEASTSIKGS